MQGTGSRSYPSHRTQPPLNPGRFKPQLLGGVPADGRCLVPSRAGRVEQLVLPPSRRSLRAVSNRARRAGYALWSECFGAAMVGR